MGSDEMEMNVAALEFMVRKTNAIIRLRQYIAANAYVLGVEWDDQPFADEVDQLLEESGAFEEEDE